jgi:hypothetical protein
MLQTVALVPLLLLLPLVPVREADIIHVAAVGRAAAGAAAEPAEQQGSDQGLRVPLLGPLEMPGDAE